MQNIASGIFALKTPVGAFSVCAEDGAKIPFTVIKNPYDVPCEVIDEATKANVYLHTKTNYNILIDSACLRIGARYQISFSAGSWDFCSSDEETCCFDSVIGNWVVGIGAYDPNDAEKTKQVILASNQIGAPKMIVDLPEYDESKLKKYTVEPLEAKNGFSFKIFDTSFSSVCFAVAWIEVKQFPTVEYENAIGIWLT